MPFMNLATYFQLIDKSWRQHNGVKVAQLLSIRDEHATYPNYQVECPNNLVGQFLSSPINDLVVFHLKCLFAIANRGYVEAYHLQNDLALVMTKILQGQKEENWCLPIMYGICSDLRLIAQQAEKEREAVTDKPGEILERTAECLMGCFRVCAADNRSSEDDTKRIGMLGLVNQLFKVYFRINKLHLCKPLIRAIESSPFKGSFSLAQQITYRYFVGRKAMFDSDYRAADEYLTYAFENCHRCSVKNKRLILIYLVPVKLLLGYTPSRKVLEQYDLVQFRDFVKAVTTGDLRLFDRLMDIHEPFFIRCGIYLIVDKLKIIAYRNLFRRIYLILKTHVIPVEAFLMALQGLGQHVDIDEAECIVANLIYEGKIKGYISHQHSKVVVSKQIPFPSLSSLL